LNNLRAIYIIWYRDMIRFWNDRLRMVGSVVIPILFLFVFSSGLGGSIGFMSPGVDFGQFLFPGIIGMTVIMNSFMAGVSVVWDREFGFLKEVLVAPINRAAVALGKTLGAATIAIIQGAIIMPFAPLVGKTLSPTTVGLLIPAMFLLAIAIGSLGVLLASRIRSIEAFQAITQMLFFPLVFLSGVFFPLQGIPGWLSDVTKVNPATYGIAIIRQVTLAEPTGTEFAISFGGNPLSLNQHVLILFGFGLVMILLAMKSFGSQD